MFGITYICECTFSNMKHIKLKHRNRLTDETLSHLLRVSSSEIEVDFAALKPHILKTLTKLQITIYI